MPGRNSFQHNGDVTVFIYERELNFLKWLVLQKPKIETGGDLFGLWQDERTAVVQCILGPGKNCRRTTTSFHQDVDYLAEAGGKLFSLLLKTPAAESRDFWFHFCLCTYVLLLTTSRLHCQLLYQYN